jgi:PEP-CTERM motif
MLKRFTIFGVMIAALAMAPAAQADPFLAGGFSLSSVGAGAGLSPLEPISATGAVLPSYVGATALDFTTTGTATPGVAGAFRVVSTSGDFNALYGLTGAIQDFTFSGLSQTNYPAPPVSGFETIVSPVFSFDLTSVTVGLQNANELDLVGSGLFHLAGFAATPGMFYFTGNQAGDTFSFSASEATVPEPGSMLLLGTGLIGLAGLVRRRTKQ